MKTFSIGIDPGIHGAISLICNPEKQVILTYRITTAVDIVSALRSLKYRIEAEDDDMVVLLEEVTGYIPGRPQPASRAFTFGVSYGSIIGVLTALGMPYRTVRPQKWQSVFRGLSDPSEKLSYEGRKQALWKEARRLYPKAGIKKAAADSVLIAEYGRRLCYGL